MEKYTLLIFPVGVLLVTFFGCKIQKFDGESKDYFDRNQSKMLQAVSCLFVVLHHLTQTVSSYGYRNVGPVTILNSMGILFTSIFFFCSGYGLIVSVNSKDTYLKDFLWRRLPTVLVPFWVTNAVYVLVKIFIKKLPMTAVQIVQCVFGYTLLNGNSWYMVEIAMLYLTFYLTFSVIKNRKIAAFVLCLLTFVLIYAGFDKGHDATPDLYHWFKGEWWVNSTIVFALGVLVATYKDIIFSFIAKHYWIMLITVSVLFFVSFWYEEKILMQYGYYKTRQIDEVNPAFITLVAQMIVCVIFTLLILVINMKIRIGNKALKLLSMVSIEIYLIHGVFIKYVENKKGISDFKIYAIVLGLAILASVPIHLIDSAFLWFVGKVRMLLKFIYEKVIVKIIANIKLVAMLLAVALVLSAVGVLIYTKFILLPNEHKAEIEALKNAQVYDVVYFGRYEQDSGKFGKERLEWIVAKKEDGKVMLVAKNGIACSAYNKKHEEVSWKESDIYHYLNGELYAQMFSKYEKADIESICDTDEKITLLSADEAIALFGDDESRQLIVTAYAEEKGANVNTPSKINYWDTKDYRTSWWWLKGENGIEAPYVTPEGSIDSKYVNKPNGAIRPVVWIHIGDGAFVSHSVPMYRGVSQCN